MPRIKRRSGNGCWTEASAYGAVSADLALLRKHMIGFAMQIVISVTASMIYFFISPVKEPT